MKLKFKILLILFLLVIFSCTTVRATYYDNLDNYKTDPNFYLQCWQDNVSITVTNYFERCLKYNTYDFSSSMIDEFEHCSVYVYPDNDSYCTYYVLTYVADMKQKPSESAFNFYIDNITCPTFAYVLGSAQVYSLYHVKLSKYGSNYIESVSYTNNSVYIPQSLYGYRSTCFDEFVDNYNNKNSTSLDTINNTILQNNQLQQQNNDLLKNANDFLQQDINKDNENIKLDQSSVENPYNENISTIFTLFKNAFSKSATDLVIPFTIYHNNTDITVPADYVSSNAPSAIVLIIQAFWWYLVVVIIYVEITNLYEKLSNAEIDKVNTTDPRVNLL